MEQTQQQVELNMEQIVAGTKIAKHPITFGKALDIYLRPTLKPILLALANVMMQAGEVVITLLELVDGETWKVNGEVVNEKNAPGAETGDSHLQLDLKGPDWMAFFSEVEYGPQGEQLVMSCAIEALNEDSPIDPPTIQFESNCPIMLLYDFALAMSGIAPLAETELDELCERAIETRTEVQKVAVRFNTVAQSWEKPIMHLGGATWLHIEAGNEEPMFDEESMSYVKAGAKWAEYLAALDDANDVPAEYRWIAKTTRHNVPQATTGPIPTGVEDPLVLTTLTRSVPVE